MHDASKSIATIVSTRVINPKIGIIWAAFWNFAALFVFGSAVAKTIGSDIVEVRYIDQNVVFIAFCSAIAWIILCTRFGLPVSFFQALIGGLVGPVVLIGGGHMVMGIGFIRLIILISLAPVFGFILGYGVLLTCLWLFRKKSPRKADRTLRFMQMVSSALFHLGHGGNDAQKTIGIITILLYSSGTLTGKFHIPYVVIFTGYLTMALGTLAGGWKIIRGTGTAFHGLKPIQGFSAEFAGAITIIACSLGGLPLSTTHTLTGSILGVGAVQRISAVRRGVGLNIILAWIMTLPITMLISAAGYWIIRLMAG
jgi:PiT family inorganic phosphate transporter